MNINIFYCKPLLAKFGNFFSSCPVELLEMLESLLFCPGRGIIELIKNLANKLAAVTVSTTSFNNCLLLQGLRRFNLSRVKTLGNLEMSSSYPTMSPDA